MYICNCCGNIFEDGEQSFWTEEHGETFSGCPVCKGDFSVLHRCEKCREIEDEDNLFFGLCSHCIKESITLESFREFLSQTDTGLLNFIFSRVFECYDIPAGGNDELYDFVKRVFVRKSYEDALNNSTEFLDKCSSYIFSDKMMTKAFAYWLKERGEKNVHS